MSRSRTDSYNSLQSRQPAGVRFLLPAVVLAFFCCLPGFSYAADAGAGQNGTGISRSGSGAALTSYREGDTDKAIEKIRKLIKDEPGNAGAHEELGYLLLKKRNLDKALEAFRAALKINPLMRTARTGIGLTLYEKGDLDAAESVITKALPLDPYPSRAHYVLGLVYEARKDYKKAIREYKEGLKTFVPGKK